MAASVEKVVMAYSLGNEEPIHGSRSEGVGREAGEKVDREAGRRLGVNEPRCVLAGVDQHGIFGRQARESTDDDSDRGARRAARCVGNAERCSDDRAVLLRETKPASRDVEGMKSERHAYS